MSKVMNPRMKGRKLNTSCGMMEFDTNGIAEVTDEQLEILKALKGYEILTEEGKPSSESDIPEGLNTSSSEEEKHQEEDAEDVSEDSDEESEEDEAELKSDVLTEDELDSLTVAQLKKVAKDNDIDLNGASKKDEIISVILGALI